jgi:hypothetical protein
MSEQAVTTRQRIFYRTTISIDVLSEEPLPDGLSLTEIDYAITDGPCVGGAMRAEQRIVTAREAADALHEFGSDPSFFQLTDDGQTIEEF